MKKAQVSTEFLFAIGVVVFLFLIVLGFSLERRSEIKRTEDSLNKRNECLKISNLITEVFINGDGTKMNATIDYNISVNSASREICVNDFCCGLSMNVVSGVELVKGGINIENKNNLVVVENV